jgi:phenylacetate-coenzyme A ligase PaaK-like adenylate-forming protein
MSAVTRRARLADVAGGVRLARRLGAHDGAGRATLEAWQRARLAELRAFARARSPFYGARDLGRTLDKPTLMEHYDEVLTDPRLSLAALEAHVDALRGDELLHGAYRVMCTGGTTGRRAVVPLGRSEWRAAMSSFFRWKALAGRRPRPRQRIAVVLAPSPQHTSWRYARTVDVGLMKLLQLNATQPTERLVACLNAFGPAELSGYPSIVAVLAREQLEGRLRIAPEFVSTTAEVRTPDMERLVEQAWGVRPFDMYAITEAGILATECPARDGLHVFEDHTLVEVLGPDGGPVADGEVGRLVITPLYARTLPLLRYEMGDLVRATRAPCACGRPYVRLLEIQGRQDDVLELPAACGGTVMVHPIVMRSPMASIPELAEYQLVHGAGGLRVRIALRRGGQADAAARHVRERLAAALADAGADVPSVGVEVVDALERSPMGKHRLVVQA